jgi:ribosomal protein S18 acetylase RimI-like enzyme
MATARAPLTNVTLTRAEPAHVDELGRICYEAFKDIADAHRFPRDIPSVQAGRQAIGMLVSRPDCYGVTAIAGGHIAGSNFLSLSDPVAGVGPITVDCAFQGQDIGRALMRDVIRYAQERGITMVRLLQDAFNVRSISLYGSLGFDTKHAVAVMSPAPAEAPDPSVRDAAESDLDAMETLSKRIYKVTRRGEVAAALQGKLPVLVRVRDGRIRAYLIPLFFGHGVGETEEDMVVLAREGARRAPEQTRVFAPLDEPDLFRAFLASGARTVKMMNLMTMGPYETPSRVWMPSVLY